MRQPGEKWGITVILAVLALLFVGPSVIYSRAARAQVKQLELASQSWFITGSTGQRIADSALCATASRQLTEARFYDLGFGSDYKPLVAISSLNLDSGSLDLKVRLEAEAEDDLVDVVIKASKIQSRWCAEDIIVYSE